MGKHQITREDDIRTLTILDLWDSKDLSNTEIRERFGVSNSAIQGMIHRCLKAPDRDHQCQCKKPENQNGGMTRGWWK